MVFGMEFIEWMAVIGGYPTIISTVLLMGMVAYAGTRAIYRHRDFSNVKYHMKETQRFEDEIKHLLDDAKPLTKWRFKHLVGEHSYTEFTYVETAPSSKTYREKFIEWRIRRAVNKVLLSNKNKNRRKHHAKDQKKLRYHRS